MNRIIESDYFLFLVIVGWQGAVGTLSLQDKPATIISLYTVVKSPWGIMEEKRSLFSGVACIEAKFLGIFLW